jgi:hypothetical protein
MIQVQTPDGVIHQFPDGTSDATIGTAMRSYMAAHPAHPSVGADVTRGAATGLTQGGAGFLGQFGDMPGLAHMGAQAVVDFLADHGIGQKGVRVPELQPMMTPGGPLANLAKRALVGAVTKGVDLALPKAVQADPRVVRGALAVANPGQFADVAPTSSQVTGALTHDQPLYEPQTTAGKYARTIASFAPAAAMPVSGKSLLVQSLQRAANVVAPGVASETAGELTAGTPYETPARIAAAIGAGGLTTAVTAPRPTTQILAKATRGATDDQIAQAEQLMTDAQARGLKITMAEALQQVTGNATGMGRLQRLVEGTRQGEEKFAPVMAQRPDQVRQAVMGYADTLAPATDAPSVIGGDAQAAASGTLDAVRRQINANADPFYKALSQEQLPAASPQYQALSQDPAYQEALSTVRADPVLNRDIANLPDNNLAVTNEVVKQLRTMSENAKPNPVTGLGSAQKSAAYDTAANGADALASDISEPWRLSRAMVASGRRAFLEPLQLGPMGKVAQTADVAAQTQALFPAQPLEGAPAETGQAMAMLGDQAPGVPASLARQHLVNALNESTQALQSGPNQYGGAKYAAVLAGNPEQRSTLLSGIEGAGGDHEDLDKLLSALAATGARQAQGSRTAFNTEDLKTLGSGGAADKLIQAAADPFEIPSRLRSAYGTYRLGSNVSRLADALLADPKTAAAQLRDARSVAPPGYGEYSIPSLEFLLLTRRQQEAAPNAPP